MRLFILLLTSVSVVLANNPILDFVDNHKDTVVETQTDVYRAPFEILHKHKGIDFRITAPMYLVKDKEYDTGAYEKKIWWKIYFIPTDFYDTIKKQASTSFKVDLSQITSNNDLTADLILDNFNAIKGHQGGKISVTSDRAGNWIANVDDIRFSDAKIEHTIAPKDGKTHTYSEMRLKLAISTGTIKVTHLFSKALDEWFAQIGIGKVTLQDNAYFPCPPAEAYSPPVAQLFIRIWLGKTSLPSLYMKEAFGSFKLPTGPEQQQFVELAKEVHATTFGDVVKQLINAGVRKPEIDKMKTIIQNANNNHIGKNPKTKKKLKNRNQVPKWNPSDVEKKTMGDIFTVLWYMGDESKCDKYVTVFKWLYGKENREDYSNGCPTKNPIQFCKNLHKLRAGVQNLQKILLKQKVKKYSFDSLFMSDALLLGSVGKDSFYDDVYEKVWYAMNGHSGYYKGFVDIQAPTEINFFSEHGLTAKCRNNDMDQRDKWNKIADPPADESLKRLFPGKTVKDNYVKEGTMIKDYTMWACEDCGKHSGIFKIKAKCQHTTKELTDDNDICEVKEKERLILPPSPGLALSAFFKSEWFTAEPGRVFYIGCRSELKDKPKLQKVLGKIEKVKVEKKKSIEETVSDEYSLTKEDTIGHDKYDAVVDEYNEYPNVENKYDGVIYTNKNNEYGSMMLNNGYSWLWIVLLEMNLLMLCVIGSCCCVCMGGMVFVGINYHKKAIEHENVHFQSSNGLV